MNTITHELDILITRGFESRDVDYKASMDWGAMGRIEKCEIVKDIMAMANYGGGWIIIGVGENPPGTFNLDGMTGPQCASFETSIINRFVQSYADPPINSDVYPVEFTGKKFVVLRIPGFPDTPHITQRDCGEVLKFPVLYYRTANNESAPISRNTDFNAVVERAITNRSDRLIGTIRKIVLRSGAEPVTEGEDRWESQISSIRALTQGVDSNG